MTELDDTRTFGRRLSGRADAARVVAAEQLQEISRLRQTMTEFVAQLSGRLINNTLEVSTRTFPTEGYLQYSWHTACGAIRVTPLGNANVTVQAAPASGSGTAPGGGTGVAVVRPANPDTIAVESTVVTLYGTAGDQVTIQAFTGAVTP